MTERDSTIDVLRFIALTGLIIIHIDPTVLWIREIRSFDVPMMVFLSGVSYMLSTGKTIQYKKYVSKRFERLILPTWIFLVLYYLFITTANYIINGSFELNTHVLVSFTFMTSWYVWVIRVFFIIALIAPLIVPVVEKYSLLKISLIFVALLFINEILSNWIVSLDPVIRNLLSMVVMTIPYMCFFIWGTIINRLSKNKQYFITAVFSVLFVLFALYLFKMNNDNVSFQTYKYPPRFYYISYGCMSIMILWLIKDFFVRFLESIKLLNCCVFIGQHTIWIYFWHVFFVWVVTDRIDSSLIRFCVVYFGAILIAYAQSRLLQYVLPRISNESVKKKINIIFNG